MANQRDPNYKYNSSKIDVRIKKSNKVRQKARERTAQMKKIQKKINIHLLDPYKYDNYNINQSQDSQSNNKANSNKINNLNIG